MQLLTGLLAILSAWFVGPALPLLAEVLGTSWSPSPESCALARTWGLELCGEEASADAGQGRRLQNLMVPWWTAEGQQNFMEECLETGNTQEECDAGMQHIQEIKQYIPQLMFFVSVGGVLFIIFTFGPCCFGLCYKRKVTDMRQRFPEPLAVQPPFSMQGATDFFKSEFGCCEQLPICFWSFFFGTVRQGDTLHTARVTDFWMPLGLFWACVLVKFMLDKIIYYAFGASTPVIGWIMALLNACVLAFWRGKLRTAHGAPIVPPPGGMFPQDVLCYFCCRPCLIAQEAQQVDGVQGIETEICCAFRMKGGMLMPGQPVVGEPRFAN